MGFWVALRFLTVLSVPWGRETSAEAVGASQVYFPLVGLFLGMLIAASAYLLHFLFPPTISAALLVALLVGLTGALHLDGLMDTADGLAWGRSPQERIAIMRQSQVGAFGVLAVLCLLLVKFSTFQTLVSEQFWRGIAAAPILSRWAIPWVAFAFPYASPTRGTGWTFKNQSTRGTALLSTIIAASLLIILLGLLGLTLIPPVGALVWLSARAIASQLGGLTGDTYGALAEISEGITLLFLVAFQR